MNIVITSPDQMYDAKYLQSILKTEAARPIIESKRNLKLIDYSLFHHWLKESNISSTIFDSQITLENLMDQCVLINNLLPQKPIDSSLSTKITNYFSQTSLTPTADLIFVFASKSLTRMEKAVQLWRQRVAPLIFIAGGHPFYQPDEISESIVYQDFAVHQGVPKDALIIEPNCVSIADNVRKGLNTLDRLGINYQKIVIVTAWYNLKRAWMMLDKYLGSNKSVYSQSADIDPSSDISPSRWSQNEFGLKIIINEFLKMRIHDYLVFNRIV